MIVCRPAVCNSPAKVPVPSERGLGDDSWAWVSLEVNLTTSAIGGGKIVEPILGDHREDINCPACTFAGAMTWKCEVANASHSNGGAACDATCDGVNSGQGLAAGSRQRAAECAHSAGQRGIGW